MAGAYRQSVSLWSQQRESDPTELASPLRHLSELMSHLGAYQAQEQFIRQLLDLADRSGDLSEQASHFTTLAGILGMTGRLQEADRAIQNAIDLAEECDDLERKAWAILNRGVLHCDAGRDDAGLADFVAAEELAQAAGIERAEAAAVGNRGIIYRRRRQIDEARICYERVEQLIRERGDIAHLTQIIGNRGVFHKDVGEYDRAMECYDEAERISRENGLHRLLLLSLVNRGVLYYELASPRRSLQDLHEAHALLHDVDDPSLVRVLKLNIAVANLDLLDRDQAAPTTDESIDSVVDNLEAIEAMLDEIDDLGPTRVPTQIQVAMAIGRARLDRLKGSTRAGLDRLLECDFDQSEESSIPEGDRIELTYWIWRLAREAASEDPEHQDVQMFRKKAAAARQVALPLLEQVTSNEKLTRRQLQLKTIRLLESDED